MILLVTFGSLNPWISRVIELNLRPERSDTMIPAFIWGVLVLVNEAVQTSGQRSWEIEHFLCRGICICAGQYSPGMDRFNLLSYRYVIFFSS